MKRSPGQTLFIDADDTLWQNDGLFRAVVRAYIEVLGARGIPPDVAVQTLDALERQRTKLNGYGVHNFQASLEDACRRLLGDAHHDEIAKIIPLCHALRRHRVVLLPQVAETLRELSGRHRLILFTKGDRDHQLEKLAQSGLIRFLHQVDVVGEKDRATYEDALRRHGVRAGVGWMVGNSPRSDVLAPLDAGLNAVYIPHPETWELEMAQLPTDHNGRLLVLERIEQLLDHF